MMSGLENRKCDNCIDMNSFEYRLVFGNFEICIENEQNDTLLADGVESMIAHPILQYSKSKINRNVSKVTLFKCPALFLRNLADVQWIQVECNQSVATHVFCLIEQVNETSIQFHPDAMFYHRECILLNTICYVFNWLRKGEPLPKRNTIIDILQFQFIFDAVAVTFPPILTNNFRQIIKYKRYSYLYDYKHYPVQNGEAEGLYIYKENGRITFIYGLNLFDCGSSSFISHAFVCDGKVDCPIYNPTDEEECKCNNSNIYPGKCKYIKTINGTMCSSFYYTSRKNECELFTFFQDITPQRKSLLSPKNFHCNNGQTISVALVNDLVIDCQNPEEDEALLDMIFKNNARFDCPHPDQLPCRTGHPRCFYISEICTFTLNSLGHLIPCRNGEHLQSCINFKCNMKFHCPSYYCIPWSYICDGKWDCPRGSDESIEHTCTERNCTNMLKCRSSQICIHLSVVCNQEVECPLGDDEYMCNLKDQICPDGCQCLTFVLRCINTRNKNVIVQNNFPFYIIYLKYNEKSFTLDILSKHIVLIFLTMQHNKKQKCYCPK